MAFALAGDARDERRGDRLRRALGEDAGLRRAGVGDVADRIDVRIFGLERPRVHRNPAALRHAAASTTAGARCFGTPRKRSYGQLRAVVEGRDATACVDRRHPAVRHELDVALGEGGDQGLRRVGRRRHRARQGQDHRDVALAADAPPGQEVVQQQRAFARRRRAFVAARRRRRRSRGLSRTLGRISRRRAARPATE